MRRCPVHRSLDSIEYACKRAAACCIQVNEYDCLLLEFVFGNRPDDAQKVRAYILEIIASDPGLQQTELVFLGLFGRSCRILESQDQQVSCLSNTSMTII